MGWFSGIGKALSNPLSAIQGATNPNPIQGIRQGWQGVRQTADNVGADVRKSWDALQPVVKGAGDQIGRDFSQLGRGQMPSGPNFRQATDQIGRDIGAGWQGARIGADSAARDTRQGFDNAGQAAAQLQQQGQRMPGGFGAMPGAPNFAQAAQAARGGMPQGLGPVPQGSKSRTPGGGVPPIMPPGGMSPGMSPGMGPQGGAMAPGSFGPLGMGQGGPVPSFSKGGAGGGMNPQQAAMTQAAAIRNAGTSPGMPTQMMR